MQLDVNEFLSFIKEIFNYNDEDFSYKIQASHIRDFLQYYNHKEHKENYTKSTNRISLRNLPFAIGDTRFALSNYVNFV